MVSGRHLQFLRRSRTDRFAVNVLQTPNGKLLVVRPEAPSSFLLLAVWPGAPSSVLAPSSKARSP